MTTILPDNGLISLKDIADQYESTPSAMQKALHDNGIPILRVGKKYTQRVVSLSAITGFMGGVDK